MIRADHFFNREAELAALDRAWNSPRSGQMAMVYGRRRLGKTYLLQRFFAAEKPPEGPKSHCYYLAEQSTADAQRRALAERLLETLPSTDYRPEEIDATWNALLRYASQQAASRREGGERIALILDEFPYLVAQTPALPSTIQAWWDREGIHLPIFVVLCGSQLSAMAALGHAGAPLFGRFNAGILKVDPLRYDDVAAFYQGAPRYGRPEKLQMYGILGGTPQYHAMADTRRPLAEEVVSLLMMPKSPLENEARYLLTSEQIRDPSPHNAILSAVARGRTQYGEIQQATGLDSATLAHPVRTLLELGWLRREIPFGERSERRGLYRIADPFLHFWYRFVSPLASAYQFSDPRQVFKAKVEPFLADYMGLYVFEEICLQWLQRHAQDRLGLTILRAGRWWSRDGRSEIDIVAELDDGTYLFCECKWSHRSPVGAGVYADLRAKVAALPEAGWRQDARCVLFSAGGFRADVEAIAADPANRLSLVRLEDLLPG